jgi:hypothetical protein
MLTSFTFDTQIGREAAQQFFNGLGLSIRCRTKFHLEMAKEVEHFTAFVCGANCTAGPSDGDHALEESPARKGDIRAEAPYFRIIEIIRPF